jgi:hypothetical protein
MTSESIERGFRGPRFWMLAAIAFALFTIVLSPATFAIYYGMLMAIAFGGMPLPLQWLMALIVIVGVPGGMAFGTATLAEFLIRKSGRPDRAPKWGWRTAVSALAVLTPAFLPVAFFFKLDDLGTPDPVAVKLAARPIVAREAPGFCTVPEWRIVDGRPELTIGVRVPEEHEYAIQMHGQDQVSQSFDGYFDSTLTAGVHDVSIRLNGANGRRDRPVAWPISVSLLALWPADSAYTNTIDARSGDSLFVIDSTGAWTSHR